jgi:hypothetical protein
MASPTRPYGVGPYGDDLYGMWFRRQAVALVAQLQLEMVLEQQRVRELLLQAELAMALLARAHPVAVIIPVPPCTGWVAIRPANREVVHA